MLTYLKRISFNELKFLQASGDWLESTSHRSNGFQISTVNQQPVSPLLFCLSLRVGCKLQGTQLQGNPASGDPTPASGL